MEKEVERKKTRVSRGPSPGLRTLERKNKQLNNATKELEEKVKNLQQKGTQRTLPRVNSRTSSRASSVPSTPSTRELPTTPRGVSLSRRGSTVNGNVASRLREREAEFQKQVTERDDQISRLKERLKVLSKKLSDSKEGTKGFKFPKEKERVESDQREESKELQNIIKQVTKERLQLERYLQIANDSLQRNNGIDLERFLSLEQTNGHLQKQLDSLDLLQQEHKLVEIQYREKEEACRELMNTLKYKSALCEDLETQLAKVIEKNTELTIANSDLQKKVVELQDASHECEELKNTLNKVESECVTAKTEVKQLSGKVRNLENVLEEMHKAAENRREIERQHKEALENLRKKQDEIEVNATRLQADTIEQLKKKILALENERRVQNEKHQNLILEMAEMKKYGGGGTGSTGSGKSLASELELEQPADNLEIDQIMAKLEQDNKFLADLEKQRAMGKGGSPLHRTNSAITDSGFLSQSSLNGGSPTSRNSQSNGNLHKLPGLTGADKINLLNGSFTGSGLLRSKVNFDTSSPLIDKDGMIEIPGKGWCYAYVARYSYDPFQHSPNDSPEAELQVNAGDYVLVYGDCDEDGFFDGELLDGRRGLVPSNFVEKLEGDDLVEFHQQVILGLGDCDDSVCTSIPQDLDFISSDEGIEDHHAPKQYLRKQPLPQYASCTDLEMTEDEGEGSDIVHKVPPPKQLTLETQMNKSLLIAWNPPDCPVNKIDCYQVVVDGAVHTTVKSTEKNLKALVSGVDPAEIHRISVKTVGGNNRASNEAACTMVFGKDAPLAPTNLASMRVTSTSATMTWIPSNTNFMHAICVNNVEVKTVKQGVFRHTIAGLQPNTMYKITVRAKNIKAAPYIAGRNFKNLSTSFEIRTQPQGLPEAPVDVQVDKGPKEGSLLVTWLPVTINPSGTSNGAPVTGYVVYADGRQIKDVDSGTADETVIDVGNAFIKKISVRTKSKDKLSNESDPCSVPVNLLAGSRKQALFKDSDSDSEGELIEKLQTVVPNMAPKPREVVINYSGYPELDSDIGPSELSDIAEEPEEGLTDSEADRDTPVIKNAAATAGKKNVPSYDRSSMYKGSGALNRWNEHGNTMNLTSSQFSAQPLTVNPPPVTNVSPPTENNRVNNSKVLINSNVTKTQINGNGGSVTKGTSNTYIVTDNNVVDNNKSNNERIRIFVALFDYDPQTMSPNPESADEELPFREGQLIKIYGDKDADGFYWGEASSRSGYVPCNMVSEVQVDDERVAEELFREQSGSAASSRSRIDDDDRWGDIYEDMPKKRKLALYDYDPTELSPNVDSEVELSFRTGEFILVYGDMDEDGFYMGELNGKRGLVPSNFLTDVPPGYDPKAAFRVTAAAAAVAQSVDGRPLAVDGRSNVDGRSTQQPRVLGQQRRW